MNMRKANKHIKDVDRIILRLLNKEISMDIAAQEFQDLGYSFEDAWERVHRLEPKSKIIKFPKKRIRVIK